MDRINPQAYAIVAALWLAAGLSNAQGQTVDVAAAKKDTKVVVYGSVVPQAMEELHRTFEKKYEIKVEYWRGSSTAVAERAQSEWRAGRQAFDVVESSWDVMTLMKIGRHLQPLSAAFGGKIPGPVQREGCANNALAYFADQHLV